MDFSPIINMICGFRGINHYRYCLKTRNDVYVWRGYGYACVVVTASVLRYGCDSSWRHCDYVDGLGCDVLGWGTVCAVDWEIGDDVGMRCGVGHHAGWGNGDDGQVICASVSQLGGEEVLVAVARERQ
jgi:hypothetical protein